MTLLSRRLSHRAVAYAIVTARIPLGENLVMKTKSSRVARFCTFLVVAGLLDFALFVGGSIFLGGDAINGKIEDGQFLVGGKGVYVPVSPAIWTYSYVHSISLWITHPIAVLGGVVLAIAAQQYASR